MRMKIALRAYTNWVSLLSGLQNPGGYLPSYRLTALRSKTQVMHEASWQPDAVCLPQCQKQLFQH